MNKRIRLVLIVALGTPLAVAALIWSLGVVHYYRSGEAEFADKFRAVSIGLPKVDVVALLGEPNGEGKEFRLGQKEGYEAAYRKAALSHSTHYLFWHRGLDTVYTIGFDAQGKVALIESGGT